MKRVLVTGAAGFLGSHIAAVLAKGGWQVTGVDRQSAAGCKHLELPSSAFEAVLNEVCPDALVHAAGPASVPGSVEDPAGDFAGSVGVFFHVIDSVRRRCPKCRVLLLSSAAVYGNPASLPVADDAPIQPISPYGFHKRACELLAEGFNRVYGVPTASLRIFSAYGPGLRRQVLWDICRKALCCPRIELFGDGREARDFVHARDVATAVAVLLERGPFDGTTYNLGHGRATTVLEVAELLRGALGVTTPLVFTGVRRPGDPLVWEAGIGRLAALGFRPSVALEDGIRDYASWARERLRTGEGP